ncbi:uncharacterized protein LY89DRAFT_597801 [Mollisia scopiformis]|uniref:Mediator of RNA polymerase II transcription subunit 8 n=1 Tax=Mollisia scopiformis TaxID=149040 RepID=A0A132BDF1_MOLSC|nr:uncharacterized protein LY89DRAFT_597801 [Mollisia scopiformis]KUJ09687.1 hypothetical protein LY89DRAFT_597801 [Mollisia scopiformis]
MAQTNFSREDVRALEATRQRLSQLTHTIHSLKTDLQQSNPLPQWSSIQTQNAILVTHVDGVTKLLSSHADLLNRTVVFPSTNYPGRTQEGLLTQLLRKKLEPQVENWVEGGRQIAQAEGLSGKDNDEFLGWAVDWTGKRIAEYAQNEALDEYTIDEQALGIENVNTGLKAKYEDDESEDSNEDEDMADAGVAVTSARRTSLGQVEYGLGEVKKQPSGTSKSVDEILRFATTGATMDHFSLRR